MFRHLRQSHSVPAQHESRHFVEEYLSVARILAEVCVVALGAVFHHCNGQVLHAQSAASGFHRHVISATSEYSAAAVFDVNHDGQLDIFCGGFWYEAPNWRRHFVRDVEKIRGRFDGYSHLPLDVNGDGWLDVITVNYRSSSIRWMQHPGPALGPWQIHTAAEPGAMETGRLFDIDNDGQQDVLPNGQEFAAWWSWSAGATAGSPVSWQRHELPAEVAGHGGGFGDIDGDGRGDIVAPTGWAQAPSNPRQDRWVFHREFDLGRASVPVLVVDVDRDGDNDLVWSRAHGFGLYWLEQDRDADNHRIWTHHAIDTSWSQCHAPLWADLDGDGQPELIAGKRYMAHDGRDPGAYEPLVAYRYQFDIATRTWQRWTVSYDQQVSFGLDPKAVDVDLDGDIDLVASGRSGLYLLENTRIVASPDSPAASAVRRDISATLPPTYDPAHGLMTWIDADDTEHPVATLADWQIRRGHILEQIAASVGPLPSSIDRVPLRAKLKPSAARADDAVTPPAPSPSVTEVTLHVMADRQVTGQLWQPPTDTAKRHPAVLIIDDNTLTTQQLAARLVADGFVCFVVALAPSGPATIAATSANASKHTTTAMNVWTGIRAVDYLESLANVDAERIGCLSVAQGNETTMLLVAYEQRIVAACCLGELELDREIDRHPSVGPPPMPALAATLSVLAPRSFAWKPDVLNSAAANDKTKQTFATLAPVFALARTARTTSATSQLDILDASDEIDTQVVRAWFERQLKK